VSCRRTNRQRSDERLSHFGRWRKREVNMDDRGFDNIARRLGGLRSRRSALKTAGCGTAAAIFAAFGLENSALAQITVERDCLVRGAQCQSARQCCGWKRNSKEIRCKTSTAGDGTRCCGQKGASCLNDTHCCSLFFCNSAQRCQLS
jgi:hypothetical protein